MADEPDAEKPRAAADAVRRLWPYIRPYRLTLVPIMLGILFDVGFDGFWPLGFKFLIDNALVPHDGRVLVVVLAALGSGVLVAAAVQVGYDFLYARLVSSVLADLRLHLFDHLQHLSLGFFARAQSGDIFSRFSGDLVAVENGLVSAPPFAVKPSLDILLSTVLLFVLDWRLAAGAMLVWPIALLGPRYFAPRAISSSYEKKLLEASALTVVEESVSGRLVVKAFGLERLRLARFQDPLSELRRTTTRVAFVSRLVERSALTGVLVLGIAVIGVGAWMTFAGYMTIGTLVAFQSLFFTLGYSIAYLTQYVPGLVQGLAGFRHIAEIFDEAPQVIDPPDAVPLPRFADEIAFRDVTFSYPEAERPSLAGFTESIPRGTSVAVVGTSGSGKSTVLNLLMRFYDPVKGAVTIDGHDLRGVTLDSLRSQIAAVFQESFLFNATIRENIELGRPGATDEEVEAAARAAEIHDFVAAEPRGYDTVVGERGGRLSGGQRQRIAIARAIVRDPAILLFDEATASLDPATENAINATVRRLAHGRTVISVTHRLSTARDADSIVVLDAGGIAERGTHSELLQAAGEYRRLWDRQSGFSISDEGDRAEVAPERLAQIPLLSGLGTGLLRELVPFFVSEPAPAGRTVIQEGDPGDRFFIIVRGRLVASTHGRDVAVLEDGDYFGEIALLRNVPRIATVRTELPSLLLSLARERFLALLDREPDMRATLERIADDRIAETLAGP